MFKLQYFLTATGPLKQSAWICLWFHLILFQGDLKKADQKKNYETILKPFRTFIASEF